jgi:hypothetical protein
MTCEQKNVYYTASGREFPPTIELLTTDLVGCYDDIQYEFDKAKNSEQRGLVLMIHHGCTKVVSSYFSGEDLEAFTKKTTEEYEGLLVKESRRSDGTLDWYMLERVTWREVEAGRMSPDNWLRLGSVQICREMYDAMQNQPKGTRWQRLTRRLRAGVADRLDG